MYSLNEEKMFYDNADGIAVVINFTTGVYYGFNQFGTAVLGCLKEGADEAAIVKAAKQIDGCPENISDTVRSFIESLLEKEILIKAGDDAKDCTISADFTKEGFIPSVEEYSEVQDLILADPIHEVDPNQGWPVLK